MPSLAEGIEWFRSIRGMIRCDTVAVHRNLLTETGLVSLIVAIESAMTRVAHGTGGGGPMRRCLEFLKNSDTLKEAESVS